MKYLVIDIETGPQSESDVMRFAPEFAAPSNYKDEAKIEAYIIDARRKWAESAALDPITGRILAVGVESNEHPCDIMHIDQFNGGERELVERTINSIDHCLVSGACVIGFNIRHFDFPYLKRRAYILGVRVPIMFDESTRDRFNRNVVDLQELWLAGDRDYKGQSLNNICRACGLGQKSGEGSEFATLYAHNRDKAISYLANDIALTTALARRMGAIQ